MALRYAYHLTTSVRAARIEREGLIPGGTDLRIWSAAEIEQDSWERQYAGASQCYDSARCVCLFPYHARDARYGDCEFRVDLRGLPGQLVGFDGDFWDPRTQECPIDSPECQEIRYWGEIPPSQLKRLA